MPREKKSAGVWVGLGFSKCTGGSVGFVFGGPSRSSRTSALAASALLAPTSSFLPLSGLRPAVHRTQDTGCVYVYAVVWMWLWECMCMCVRCPAAAC
jgi:hypothetical protein